MNFINVKLERRFSEKSVFLSEDRDLADLYFRIADIYWFILPVCGFKIVRTVSHFNSHCDLDKPKLHPRLILFQSLL